MTLRAPFPWFTFTTFPWLCYHGSMTIEQRFWAKVRKTASCWIWTASKRNKGYGAFAYTRDGKMIHDRAHRYSWEIHNRPIPDGLFVLHNCPGGDNPACVNPAHLFLGTKAVNNADTIAKGRYNHSRLKGDQSNYPRGEKHPNARLTAEDIIGIRSARAGGESFGSISRRTGLSVGYVFRVVNRKVWEHV